MAELRRDVFQAIADPTRRDILQLLGTGPMNLNAIAENFPVSRPAISQHIKILTECGLVYVKQHGRERYCEARLQKLTEVTAWIEKQKQFWHSKLDALGEMLENENKSTRSSKIKSKTHGKKQNQGQRRSG
jgi:DNA-binding transcriptional ArsR family regulator